MGILKYNKIKRIIYSVNEWRCKFKYAYKLFKFGLTYSQLRLYDKVYQFIWNEFISFVQSNYQEMKKISDSNVSDFYKYKYVLEIYDWYTSGINAEIESQKDLFKQWLSFKPLKLNLTDGEISIYDVEKR